MTLATRSGGSLRRARWRRSHKLRLVIPSEARDLGSLGVKSQRAQVPRFARDDRSFYSGRILNVATPATSISTTVRRPPLGIENFPVVSTFAVLPVAVVNTSQLPESLCTNGDVVRMGNG